MKKKRFATIVAALLVISLASCSTPAGSLPSAPDGSHVPEKTQALYSNLTDDSSRREVVDALQAHGVSQEQTDTLLAWADDFNARVTTPTLTEGFTAMEGDFVDYSSLLFDIKELPDGTFFMEANCRLTAFLLMRDQLQTCGTADESDTYLMFDIEAIDTQKEYQLSSEARADSYNFQIYLFTFGNLRDRKVINNRIISCRYVRIAVMTRSKNQECDK